MRFIFKFSSQNWMPALVATSALACALVVMIWIPDGAVQEIHHADDVRNFALVDPRPQNDDWPWWRGANSQNVAKFDQIPRVWSLSNHDGWPVPLRGIGHATPILWSDQLFLLSGDKSNERILVASFDRDTGREIWQTEIHRGGLPLVHEKNTHASATPVCDGQFIYTVAVTNAQLIVSSIDIKGRISWQKSPGAYASEYGYSSSMALFQSLIIVNADQRSDGYLAAFHRQTGDVIWRVKRPDGECYGTPIVATISGRPQLIIPGSKFVISYDPATGNERWRYRWASERNANSVAFDEEHVYATTRYPNSEVICIQADGSGDITNSHLAWRQPGIGSEVPSPVCHAGFLYVLADDGLLSCLETATGKIEWKKRLSANFSASPVVAQDSIICCGESGRVYVVRGGVASDLTIEHSLPEEILASPIVADNTVYIRTRNHLYRFQSPAKETLAEKPEPVKARY